MTSGIGERDLGDHEARGGTARRDELVIARRAVLECAVQVGPPRVDDRRDAEHQRGGDAQAAANSTAVASSRELGVARCAAREDRDHAVDAPHRGEHASAAAAQPEHQALGDQLAHEAPPAGAERVANGDLAGAGLGARDEQIGDVDDRDHQHEQHAPATATTGSRADLTMSACERRA